MIELSPARAINWIGVLKRIPVVAEVAWTFMCPLLFERMEQRVAVDYYVLLAAITEATSTKSLFECGLDVLLTEDVFIKAEKTLRYAAMWKSQQLSQIRGPDDDLTKVPDSPARPQHLKTVEMRQMKGGTKKALIHSVIHAESYAIDLMWDLVCRFSYHTELPIEFYNDWVRIAGEEAQHFGSWADRYVELGGSYGDLPVHDGLWDSAKDTKHSLLARLAIVHGVHEARGLDVYPQAVARLNKSKDTKSLAIMGKNHAEEVTHVGAAVKWFSFLCEKENNDPVATFHSIVQSNFGGKLKPPFNDAARHKAGMSPEWYLPLA